MVMITNRKCWIDPLSSLRDFLFWLDTLPSHKWLGYFQNWTVIALGGIPNKVQVGGMGIDARIAGKTTGPGTPVSFPDSPVNPFKAASGDEKYQPKT
jgi:hypothetical protein